MVAARSVNAAYTTKNQGISAYDPRVIEVTGISMMMTAQGADHTTGNAPDHDCKDKTIEELTAESMTMQVACAVADCIGICIFGNSVTRPQQEMIVDTLNEGLGTKLETSFLNEMACETLKMEWRFNELAGFTCKDDELPAFFYDEPLAPTGKIARHHATEIKKYRDEWMGMNAG